MFSMTGGQRIRPLSSTAASQPSHQRNVNSKPNATSSATSQTHTTKRSASAAGGARAAPSSAQAQSTSLHQPRSQSAMGSSSSHLNRSMPVLGGASYGAMASTNTSSTLIGPAAANGLPALANKALLLPPKSSNARSSSSGAGPTNACVNTSNSVVVGGGGQQQPSALQALLAANHSPSLNMTNRYDRPEGYGIVDENYRRAMLKTGIAGTAESTEKLLDRHQLAKEAVVAAATATQQQRYDSQRSGSASVRLTSNSAPSFPALLTPTAHLQYQQREVKEMGKAAATAFTVKTAADPPPTSSSSLRNAVDPTDASATVGILNSAAINRPTFLFQTSEQVAAETVKKGVRKMKYKLHVAATDDEEKEADWGGIGEEDAHDASKGMGNAFAPLLASTGHNNQNAAIGETHGNQSPASSSFGRASSIYSPLSVSSASSLDEVSDHVTAKANIISTRHAHHSSAKKLSAAINNNSPQPRRVIADAINTAPLRSPSKTPVADHDLNTKASIGDLTKEHHQQTLTRLTEAALRQHDPVLRHWDLMAAKEAIRQFEGRKNNFRKNLHVRQKELREKQQKLQRRKELHTDEHAGEHKGGDGDRDRLVLNNDNSGDESHLSDAEHDEQHEEVQWLLKEEEIKARATILRTTVEEELCTELLEKALRELSMPPSSAAAVPAKQPFAAASGGDNNSPDSNSKGVRRRESSFFAFGSSNRDAGGLMVGISRNDGGRADESAPAPSHQMPSRRDTATRPPSGRPPAARNSTDNADPFQPLVTSRPGTADSPQIQPLFATENAAGKNTFLQGDQHSHSSGAQNFTDYVRGMVNAGGNEDPTEMFLYENIAEQLNRRGSAVPTIATLAEYLMLATAKKTFHTNTLAEAAEVVACGGAQLVTPRRKRIPKVTISPDESNDDTSPSKLRQLLSTGLSRGPAITNSYAKEKGANFAAMNLSTVRNKKHAHVEFLATAKLLHPDAAKRKKGSEGLTSRRKVTELKRGGASGDEDSDEEEGLNKGASSNAKKNKVALTNEGRYQVKLRRSLLFGKDTRVDPKSQHDHHHNANSKHDHSNRLEAIEDPEQVPLMASRMFISRYFTHEFLPSWLDESCANYVTVRLRGKLNNNNTEAKQREASVKGSSRERGGSDDDNDVSFGGGGGGGLRKQSDALGASTMSSSAAPQGFGNSMLRMRRSTASGGGGGAFGASFNRGGSSSRNDFFGQKQRKMSLSVSSADESQFRAGFAGGSFKAFGSSRSFNLGGDHSSSDEDEFGNPKPPRIFNIGVAKFPRYCAPYLLRNKEARVEVDAALRTANPENRNTRKVETNKRLRAMREEAVRIRSKFANTGGDHHALDDALDFETDSSCSSYTSDEDRAKRRRNERQRQLRRFRDGGDPDVDDDDQSSSGDSGSASDENEVSDLEDTDEYGEVTVKGGVDKVKLVADGKKAARAAALLLIGRGDPNAIAAIAPFKGWCFETLESEMNRVSRQAERQKIRQDKIEIVEAFVKQWKSGQDKQHGAQALQGKGFYGVFAPNRSRRNERDKPTFDDFNGSNTSAGGLQIIEPARVGDVLSAAAAQTTSLNVVNDRADRQKGLGFNVDDLNASGVTQTFSGMSRSRSPRATFISSPRSAVPTLSGSVTPPNRASAGRSGAAVSPTSANITASSRKIVFTASQSTSPTTAALPSGGGGQRLAGISSSHDSTPMSAKAAARRATMAGTRRRSAVKPINISAPQTQADLNKVMAHITDQPALIGVDLFGPIDLSEEVFDDVIGRERGEANAKNSERVVKFIKNGNNSGSSDQKSVSDVFGNLLDEVPEICKQSTEKALVDSLERTRSGAKSSIVLPNSNATSGAVASAQPSVFPTISLTVVSSPILGPSDVQVEEENAQNATHTGDCIDTEAIIKAQVASLIPKTTSEPSLLRHRMLHCPLTNSEQKELANRLQRDLELAGEDGGDDDCENILAPSQQQQPSNLLVNSLLASSNPREAIAELHVQPVYRNWNAEYNALLGKMEPTPLNCVTVTAEAVVRMYAAMVSLANEFKTVAATFVQEALLTVLLVHGHCEHNGITYTLQTLPMMECAEDNSPFEDLTRQKVHDIEASGQSVQQYVAASRGGAAVVAAPVVAGGGGGKDTIVPQNSFSVAAVSRQSIASASPSLGAKVAAEKRNAIAVDPLSAEVDADCSLIAAEYTRKIVGNEFKALSVINDKWWRLQHPSLACDEVFNPFTGPFPLRPEMPRERLNGFIATQQGKQRNNDNTNNNEAIGGGGAAEEPEFAAFAANTMPYHEEGSMSAAAVHGRQQLLGTTMANGLPLYSHMEAEMNAGLASATTATGNAAGGSLSQSAPGAGNSQSNTASASALIGPTGLPLYMKPVPRVRTPLTCSVTYLGHTVVCTATVSKEDSAPLTPLREVPEAFTKGVADAIGLVPHALVRDAKTVSAVAAGGNGRGSVLDTDDLLVRVDPRQLPANLSLHAMSTSLQKFYCSSGLFFGAVAAGNSADYGIVPPDIAGRGPRHVYLLSAATLLPALPPTAGYSRWSRMRPEFFDNYAEGVANDAFAPDHHRRQIVEAFYGQAFADQSTTSVISSAATSQVATARNRSIPTTARTVAGGHNGSTTHMSNQQQRQAMAAAPSGGFDAAPNDAAVIIDYVYVHRDKAQIGHVKAMRRLLHKGVSDVVDFIEALGRPLQHCELCELCHQRGLNISMLGRVAELLASKINMYKEQLTTVAKDVDADKTTRNLAALSGTMQVCMEEMCLRSFKTYWLQLLRQEGRLLQKALVVEEQEDINTLMRRQSASAGPVSLSLPTSKATNISERTRRRSIGWLPEPAKAQLTTPPSPALPVASPKGVGNFASPIASPSSPKPAATAGLSAIIASQKSIKDKMLEHSKVLFKGRLKDTSTLRTMGPQRAVLPDDDDAVFVLAEEAMQSQIGCGAQQNVPIANAQLSKLLANRRRFRVAQFLEKEALRLAIAEHFEERKHYAGGVSPTGGGGGGLTPPNRSLSISQPLSPFGTPSAQRQREGVIERSLESSSGRGGARGGGAASSSNSSSTRSAAGVPFAGTPITPKSLQEDYAHHLQCLSTVLIKTLFGKETDTKVAYMWRSFITPIMRAKFKFRGQVTRSDVRIRTSLVRLQQLAGLCVSEATEKDLEHDWLRSTSKSKKRTKAKAAQLVVSTTPGDSDGNKSSSKVDDPFSKTRSRVVSVVKFGADDIRNDDGGADDTSTAVVNMADRKDIGSDGVFGSREEVSRRASSAAGKGGGRAHTSAASSRHSTHLGVPDDFLEFSEDDDSDCETENMDGNSTTPILTAIDGPRAALTSQFLRPRDAMIRMGRSRSSDSERDNDDEDERSAMELIGKMPQTAASKQKKGVEKLQATLTRADNAADIDDRDGDDDAPNNNHVLPSSVNVGSRIGQGTFEKPTADRARAVLNKTCRATRACVVGSVIQMQPVVKMPRLPSFPPLWCFLEPNGNVRTALEAILANTTQMQDLETALHDPVAFHKHLSHTEATSEDTLIEAMGGSSVITLEAALSKDRHRKKAVAAKDAGGTNVADDAAAKDSPRSLIKSNAKESKRRQSVQGVSDINNQNNSFHHMHRDGSKNGDRDVTSARSLSLTNGVVGPYLAEHCDCTLQPKKALHVTVQGSGVGQFLGAVFSDALPLTIRLKDKSQSEVLRRIGLFNGDGPSENWLIFNTLETPASSTKPRKLLLTTPLSSPTSLMSIQSSIASVLRAIGDRHFSDCENMLLKLVLRSQLLRVADVGISELLGACLRLGLLYWVERRFGDARRSVSEAIAAEKIFFAGGGDEASNDVFPTNSNMSAFNTTALTTANATNSSSVGGRLILKVSDLEAFAGTDFTGPIRINANTTAAALKVALMSKSERAQYFTELQQMQQQKSASGIAGALGRASSFSRLQNANISSSVRRGSFSLASRQAKRTLTNSSPSAAAVTFMGGSTNEGQNRIAAVSNGAFFSHATDQSVNKETNDSNPLLNFTPSNQSLPAGSVNRPRDASSYLGTSNAMAPPLLLSVPTHFLMRPSEQQRLLLSAVDWSSRGALSSSLRMALMFGVLGLSELGDAHQQAAIDALETTALLLIAQLETLRNAKKESLSAFFLRAWPKMLSENYLIEQPPPVTAAPSRGGFGQPLSRGTVGQTPRPGESSGSFNALASVQPKRSNLQSVFSERSSSNPPLQQQPSQQVAPLSATNTFLTSLTAYSNSATTLNRSPSNLNATTSNALPVGSKANPNRTTQVVSSGNFDFNSDDDEIDDGTASVVLNQTRNQSKQQPPSLAATARGGTMNGASSSQFFFSSKTINLTVAAGFGNGKNFNASVKEATLKAQEKYAKEEASHKRHIQAVADYDIHLRMELLQKVLLTLVTAYHPQVGDVLYAHVPRSSMNASSTAGIRNGASASAGVGIDGGAGGKFATLRRGGNANAGMTSISPPASTTTPTAGSPNTSHATAAAVTLAGYNLGVASCLIGCSDFDRVPSYPHTPEVSLRRDRAAFDIQVCKNTLHALAIDLPSATPTMSLKGADGIDAAMVGVSTSVHQLESALDSKRFRSLSSTTAAKGDITISTPSLVFIKYLHFNARHALMASGNIAAALTLYQRALHIVSVIREAVHAWEKEYGALSEEAFDSDDESDDGNTLDADASQANEVDAFTPIRPSPSHAPSQRAAAAEDDEVRREAKALEAARQRVTHLKRLVIVLHQRVGNIVEGLKDSQQSVSQST